jgi:hypothetical protein
MNEKASYVNIPVANPATEAVVPVRSQPRGE